VLGFAYAPGQLQQGHLLPQQVRRVVEFAHGFVCCAGVCWGLSGCVLVMHRDSKVNPVSSMSGCLSLWRMAVWFGVHCAECAVLRCAVLSCLLVMHRDSEVNYFPSRCGAWMSLHLVECTVPGCVRVCAYRAPRHRGQLLPQQVGWCPGVWRCGNVVELHWAECSVLACAYHAEGQRGQLLPQQVGLVSLWRVAVWSSVRWLMLCSRCLPPVAVARQTTYLLFECAAGLTRRATLPPPP
jgi:hypothetical protein